MILNNKLTGKPLFFSLLLVVLSLVLLIALFKYYNDHVERCGIGGGDGCGSRLIDY